MKIPVNKNKSNRPLILAPAGNRASFLAALAAGADAVYCGLKSFSARMEAKNFTVEELIPLTKLAHKKGCKVYLTMNSLIKQSELEKAGTTLKHLAQKVKPDAIIIQDLAFIKLAQQAGFKNEIHLSTLANISFPAALKNIQEKLSASRVVIPRELNIDEIKAMAQKCPEKTDLEIFIHGALCYSVSGRCYWSSYMGGRSGLRGRCVQPCRRLYSQDNQRKRFFACHDLSLDVLVKVLLNVSKINTWKIEGRKKGPHYVFYTVKAYQALRDHGTDPEKKKAALALLSRALGREDTHYNFLPQRPQNPLKSDRQTGSGFFIGKISGTKNSLYIIPREELMAGDTLRIGYQDESWHAVKKINRNVPKRGKIYLKFPHNRRPANGTSVFLTDRLEKELKDMLAQLEKQLSDISEPVTLKSDFKIKFPSAQKNKIKKKPVNINVFRRLPKTKQRDITGIWLCEETKTTAFKRLASDIWWWLPPVIWPDDQQKLSLLIKYALKSGAKNFVLNAPWQNAFFTNKKELNLWAGPFCNTANTFAIDILASMGFKGVVVSPELSKNDFLSLPGKSALPLGVVISGNWPLGISRIVPENIKTDEVFYSPKREGACVKKYGSSYWVYPDWEIDLSEKKNILKKAGYALFVHIKEPVEQKVPMKKRPGLWNWNIELV